MSKIPVSDQRPRWISENVPEELINSSLFRLVVKLQATEQRGDGSVARKEVTVDLLPDVDVDYDLLEHQMEQTPAQYTFWAAVYSEVRLAVAVAERNLKVRRGQAIEAVNKKLADDKVKLSADLVKTVIESDKMLIEADMRLQTAQMQAGKLYHMLEALKMKAELLRSLAGFKRQEHERS